MVFMWTHAEPEKNTVLLKAVSLFVKALMYFTVKDIIKLNYRQLQYNIITKKTRT